METENQGERFRILEAAIPPSGPNAPNRLRLLIMGLFLAVLAAGVAVLMVEQFDTSFHSVDDLRQFTSVPVLVAIPRIASLRAGSDAGCEPPSSPRRCSSGSCSWERCPRTWHGTTSRWCACWFER